MAKTEIWAYQHGQAAMGGCVDECFVSPTPNGITPVGFQSTWELNPWVHSVDKDLLANLDPAGGVLWVQYVSPDVVGDINVRLRVCATHYGNPRTTITPASVFLAQGKSPLDDKVLKPWEGVKASVVSSPVDVKANDKIMRYGVHGIGNDKPKFDELKLKAEAVGTPITLKVEDTGTDGWGITSKLYYDGEIDACKAVYRLIVPAHVRAKVADKGGKAGTMFGIKLEGPVAGTDPCQPLTWADLPFMIGLDLNFNSFLTHNTQ